MKRPLLTGFTGRLFLWFWLSLTLLLLANFLLVRYLNDYPKLADPNKHQTTEIIRVEKTLQRFEGKSVEALKKSRWGRALILFDDANLQPLNRRFDHWRLPELVANDRVQILHWAPDRAAAGPFSLNAREGKFRVVWIMPPEELPFWKRFLVTSPGWRLSISMLLVLTLSIVLARWLSGPIRHLSAAARDFGNGNLDVRVAPIKGELGQLGQDFNSMATKLQRSIKSQQRLLADVSHELRSPLTRLKLAAGLLADQAQNTYTDRIEKECETLEHLVEQVLTLSRLEGSLYQDQPEPEDLVQVMGDIIQDWRFQMPGIELHYQAPDTLLTQVYPRLLQRVLDNLLGNACRHGSRVDATLRSSADGWSATVEDNGPGVADDMLEHLFEPFFRGDPARGHEGHIGLGLAIAEAAARAQGGTLKVTRSPLGGLLFILDVVTAPADR